MLKDIYKPKRLAVGASIGSDACAVVAVMLLAFMARGAIAQVPLIEQSDSHSTVQPATVDTSTPLTLESAVALAMEHNPDLIAAKREVDAVEGQVLQGQARPNPELAYSLEDVRAQTRTQTVQINFPMELGGKRAARIAAAERARDLAQMDINARRTALRADVVVAYFEALLARERSALAMDSVELARAAAGAVAKRVVAGKVSPVEESKAQVAEVGARLEAVQAYSEQRGARARLAKLLGKPALADTQLEGKIDALPAVLSVEEMQQRLSSSPTVKLAQLEIERRQAQTEVERSKQVPDVTLSLGLKHSNESQRNQILLGLAVPLPVSDRNQGNLLEALRREDKARDELQAVISRLDGEATLARERLGSARVEIDALQRDVLPSAKSIYEAATVGFENGKFSFLEVLDAQRTYFAAKSQYLKVLAEFHRAAVDIDRVLGDLSTVAPMPATSN